MTPFASALMRGAAALALCAPLVAGQWSSDAAANFAVADGGSDQSQAKVVAAPDGGTWISWFDGIGTGWDVRVQKLDADGKEVFAHGGVLVADRGFSSTQDYGLDVHASGDALLTFRDDGGTGIQITAARVSGSGDLVWGAAGVQLTSTTAFVAAPAIAGTSDGGAVVAWTQDSETRVQKLDATGAPAWGAGVTLTPGVGSYSVSDMHGAGGGAILSFVHQTGGFGSPRHLLAQKFDGSGNLLWGAGHVAVFDGGSLQFGNFPDFEPDGAGGAVFSWYDTASLQLQCYAQHVLADGTEAYPHNGVAGSTDATRVRVSPHADYDGATGDVVMFWVELNANQSQSGLYGQRFDASGVRQWGAAGVELVPVSATSVGEVRALVNGEGSFVFWDESASFGNDTLRAARVSAAGSFDIGPLTTSSNASGKSRVDVDANAAGHAVLAWKDDRDDAGDIYVQNVSCAGTLGPSTWTSLGFGTPGLYGFPRLRVDSTLLAGCPIVVGLENAREFSVTFLVVGVSAIFAPFSGGTLVPALTPPQGTYVVLFTDAAGRVDISATWPGIPSGTDLYMQFWTVDAAGIGGHAASNAVTATAP